MVTDREYRRFLILFMVNGGASSAGMPLVSLFLTQELDASLAEVGVVTVAGLLVIVTGPVVGGLSDRMRSRSPLMVGLAVWMAAGWAVYPFVDVFWLAIAVQVVMLSWIGPLNAQIFASLSETLEERAAPNASTITSTLRGGYSLGFMIGPVVSTALVTLVDLRTAFALAVALYLVTATLGWRSPVAAKRARGDGEPKAKARNGSILPLLVFASGACLVMVGDMLRAVYLPIYVVEELGHSAAMFGALISVAAGLEILAFPLVGRLADRFGVRRVMMAGLGAGIAAHTVLATSSSLWQVWLFTVLTVVVFTVTMGLGVTYAQSLAPGQRGLAASMFFSAQTGAMPVSGIVTAAAVGSLGLPGIFWVPAGLCAVCLVALVLASRRTSRRPAAEAAAEPR
ncbi:MFS transporter [Stackebrandtia nassauensis]|uniref:Major facilitator superfamily MFS_1 n=1 Tax=Stackebrandtia nassauensis (strain DSM 44728 / CIP 108903 / NRRL B-16338 / NBRC 102104 / LLR-40K-21) TaxID=446470 RepID=D3PUQ1_STANL|nr:MFS transporter [Stackebrandtia nassauensis]ADD44925.1 major facilitator superfamily MFS_1 [Stackebrandtia nassauensis DSM 44728]